MMDLFEPTATYLNAAFFFLLIIFIEFSLVYCSIKDALISVCIGFFTEIHEITPGSYSEKNFGIYHFFFSVGSVC